MQTFAKVFLRFLCRDDPYLLLVCRIQREPERHSAPLPSGDSSDAVGVFLSCCEANHASTPRTHLSLETRGHVERSTFIRRSSSPLDSNVKIYRHCFCIQLGEDEIASFKILVEIKDGAAGTRGRSMSVRAEDRLCPRALEPGLTCSLCVCTPEALLYTRWSQTPAGSCRRGRGG